MTPPDPSDAPRRRRRRGSRGGRGRRPADLTISQTQKDAPAQLAGIGGDVLSSTTYQEARTMSQHPTTDPGRSSRPGGPVILSPVDPDPATAYADPALTAEHGYHSTWCNSDAAETGADVAEHGHLCESRAVPVDAWGAHQEPRTVWAAAVQPYRSGSYVLDDVRGRPARPFVKLTWEEDSPAAAAEWGAFLTPGEARSLAAALTHMADTAEGLDLPARRHGGEAR